MNILFVSSFYLFPETRFGGSKRLLSIARKLAERHTLFLIHFDGCYELENVDSLPETGFKRQLYIHRPDEKTTWEWLLKPNPDISGNLFQKITRIEQFLNNQEFDIKVFAFPKALSLLKLKLISNGGQNWYIEDDLLIEKIREERERASNILIKLWKSYRIKQLKNFYRSVSSRIERFIAISEEEKDIGSALFPGSRLTVFKYGIEPSRFKFHVYRGGRQAVGFIGNYRHTPNMDALEFIMDSMINYIYELGYRLVLAGANLPDLSCYKEYDNVCLLGEVGSLEDFYKEVDVFINPILSGRGLRTKLVEAAAAGLPIVSTALGAEGLNDLDIIKGENAEELVSGIRKLFENKTLMQSVAVKNRKTVLERYNLNNLIEQRFIRESKRERRKT